MTTEIATSRPEADEFSGPFAGYVAFVPEGRILDLLDQQLKETVALLRPLSENQAMTVHAPYTWTIKDALAHITDAERVFAYRALRAARGDATPLPGFDENEYARQARASLVPHHELLAEFEHVRQSTLLLLRHLEPDAWLRRVAASGTLLSVRPGPTSSPAMPGIT